jgi:DNA repair exonuclease SbcCD nuclease subunit
MSTFRFLHSADLHLDSPLIGLSGKSTEFADLVAEASRQAFDNLVSTAIETDCRFVVLAGDIFDGDLRDIRSGRHFAKKLHELKEARIETYMVLGNHDAENRFVGHLKLGEVAHVFSSREAETFEIEELVVAIHGRSFPKRDVTENIAAEYPPPRPGYFNIGVLHTACQGQEDGHATYAPCTVEQLVNHGYDYWALGHVHKRAVLNEDPWVVYPGNLQGRHAREAGPKGVTIVEVVDGQVTELKDSALDAVRWATMEIQTEAADEISDLLERIGERVEEAAAAADDRLLAIRLVLTGETAAHDELLSQRADFLADVETRLATLPGDHWLERLEIRTRRPWTLETTDATVAGILTAEMERLSADPKFAAVIERHIQEIASKIPASAHGQQLFERLRANLAQRAVDLAKSYVLSGSQD